LARGLAPHAGGRARERAKAARRDGFSTLVAGAIGAGVEIAESRDERLGPPGEPRSTQLLVFPVLDDLRVVDQFTRQLVGGRQSTSVAETADDQVKLLTESAFGVDRSHHDLPGATAPPKCHD